MIGLGEIGDEKCLLSALVGFVVVVAAGRPADPAVLKGTGERKNMCSFSVRIDAYSRLSLEAVGLPRPASSSGTI